MEQESEKVGAINHQLREDTWFAVGSCSLYSFPFPVQSRQVMLLLERLTKAGKEDCLFAIGICSLHSRLYPMRYHHAHTYLTKAPHLGHYSRSFLRSSLVLALLSQRHHNSSTTTLVLREKVSKVRKTCHPRILSVQSLHQTSWSLPDFHFWMQGYTILWL